MRGLLPNALPVGLHQHDKEVRQDGSGTKKKTPASQKGDKGWSQTRGGVKNRTSILTMLATVVVDDGVGEGVIDIHRSAVL